MSVAAVAADAAKMTENLAASEPNAAAASIRSGELAPDGDGCGDLGYGGWRTFSGAAEAGMGRSATGSESATGTVRSAAADRDFRSHWEAMLGVTDARRGHTLDLEASAGSELRDAVRQNALGDVSRAAAAMSRPDAALATGSLGEIEGKSLNGSGSLPAVDQLNDDLWNAKEADPAHPPGNRDNAALTLERDGSRSAKIGGHTSGDTIKEPRASASVEGTAVLASAAQSAMIPVPVVESVRIQESPKGVAGSVGPVSDSAHASGSGVNSRGPQAADSPQLDITVSERPTSRGESQPSAVMPGSSARFATADEAAIRENTQATNKPGEGLESTSAGGHALHVGGQVFSKAVDSTAGAAVTSALADRGESGRANPAIDPTRATAGDVDAPRGADGNETVSLAAGAERALAEKSGRTGSAAAMASKSIDAHAPQVLGLDAPACVHISESGRAMANVISGQASAAITPESGSTATTVADTFSALDSGTRVGRPSWVHAGSRRAEAGFEDPALGWVGVRADLTGGAVHAALLPGSAEAAQVLGAHLPGLGAYLAQQHAPVADLMMATDDSGARFRPGQNMNQGADQNGQNTSTETQTRAETDLRPGSDRDLPDRAVAGAAKSAALIGGLSGTYISVLV